LNSLSSLKSGLTCDKIYLETLPSLLHLTSDNYFTDDGSKLWCFMTNFGRFVVVNSLWKNEFVSKSLDWMNSTWTVRTNKLEYLSFNEFYEYNIKCILKSLIGNVLKKSMKSSKCRRYQHKYASIFWTFHNIKWH